MSSSSQRTADDKPRLKRCKLLQESDPQLGFGETLGIHACSPARIYGCVWVCVCACMCLYGYASVCMCICMYNICIYRCMHTYMHTYILRMYTHTCTHIIFIYIYIHTRIFQLPFLKYWAHEAYDGILQSSMGLWGPPSSRLQLESHYGSWVQNSSISLGLQIGPTVGHIIL